MTEDNNPDEEPISKSQRKRDMQSLKDMASRLTTMPDVHLENIDPDIEEAVSIAKKITKGNAKKRQIQYIAKLLAKIDTSTIQKTLDMLDASSAAHVNHFHQLEDWRERLIEGDPSAMDEILSAYPAADRQQLRTTTRHAVAEREKGEQQRHYRKLFQFLKTLDNNPSDED